MWVKFTEDFPWHPMPAITILYRAGMVLFVTRRCARAAIESGRAIEVPRPNREYTDR